MRRMIAAGPPSKRPPHIRFVGGLVWFGTVAVALLLTLSAVTAAERKKPSRGVFPRGAPPQPAPEVAFTDIEGKPASLSDFKGKPAVVNLWATWCQPCLKEMPSLERLQAELDGKLTVAAGSEERGGGQLLRPLFAPEGPEKNPRHLPPAGPPRPPPQPPPVSAS